MVQQQEAPYTLRQQHRSLPHTAPGAPHTQQNTEDEVRFAAEALDAAADLYSTQDEAADHAWEGEDDSEQECERPSSSQ